MLKRLKRKIFGKDSDSRPPAAVPSTTTPAAAAARTGASGHSGAAAAPPAPAPLIPPATLKPSPAGPPTAAVPPAAAAPPIPTPASHDGANTTTLNETGWTFIGVVERGPDGKPRPKSGVKTLKTGAPQEIQKGEFENGLLRYGTITKGPEVRTGTFTVHVGVPKLLDGSIEDSSKTFTFRGVFDVAAAASRLRVGVTESSRTTTDGIYAVCRSGSNMLVEGTIVQKSTHQVTQGYFHPDLGHLIRGTITIANGVLKGDFSLPSRLHGYYGLLAEKDSCWLDRWGDFFGSSYLMATGMSLHYNLTPPALEASSPAASPTTSSAAAAIIPGAANFDVKASAAISGHSHGSLPSLTVTASAGGGGTTTTTTTISIVTATDDETRAIRRAQIESLSDIVGRGPAERPTCTLKQWCHVLRVVKPGVVNAAFTGVVVSMTPVAIPTPTAPISGHLQAIVNGIAPTSTELGSTLLVRLVASSTSNFRITTWDGGAQPDRIVLDLVRPPSSSGGIVRGEGGGEAHGGRPCWAVTRTNGGAVAMPLWSRWFAGPPQKTDSHSSVLPPRSCQPPMLQLPPAVDPFLLCYWKPEGVSPAKDWLTEAHQRVIEIAYLRGEHVVDVAHGCRATFSGALDRKASLMFLPSFHRRRGGGAEASGAAAEPLRVTFLRTPRTMHSVLVELTRKHSSSDGKVTPTPPAGATTSEVPSASVPTAASSSSSATAATHRLRLPLLTRHFILLEMDERAMVLSRHPVMKYSALRTIEQLLYSWPQEFKATVDDRPVRTLADLNDVVKGRRFQFHHPPPPPPSQPLRSWVGDRAAEKKGGPPSSEVLPCASGASPSSSSSDPSFSAKTAAAAGCDVATTDTTAAPSPPSAVDSLVLADPPTEASAVHRDASSSSVHRDDAPPRVAPPSCDPTTTEPASSSASGGMCAYIAASAVPTLCPGGVPHPGDAAATTELLQVDSSVFPPQVRRCRSVVNGTHGHEETPRFSVEESFLLQCVPLTAEELVCAPWYARAVMSLNRGGGASASPHETVSSAAGDPSVVDGASLPSLLLPEAAAAAATMTGADKSIHSTAPAAPLLVHGVSPMDDVIVELCESRVECDVRSVMSQLAHYYSAVAIMPSINTTPSPAGGVNHSSRMSHIYDDVLFRRTDVGIPRRLPETDLEHARHIARGGTNVPIDHVWTAVNEAAASPTSTNPTSRITSTLKVRFAGADQLSLVSAMHAALRWSQRGAVVRLPDDWDKQQEEEDAALMFATTSRSNASKQHRGAVTTALADDRGMGELERQGTSVVTEDDRSWTNDDEDDRHNRGGEDGSSDNGSFIAVASVKPAALSAGLTPAFRLVTILPSSPEFASIKAKLHSDVTFTPVIHTVQRVQNPEEYRRYVLKLRSVASENGGDANELKWMFHGTRTTDPQQLITHGFDHRYSEKGMFGRATYFAYKSSYSHGYRYNLPKAVVATFAAGPPPSATSPVPGGVAAATAAPPSVPSAGAAAAFPPAATAAVPTTAPAAAGPPKVKSYGQMLLACVCRGKIDVRKAETKDLVHPAAGCHSVEGPVSLGHLAVMIYDLHQAYPAYLVTYEF